MVLSCSIAAVFDQKCHGAGDRDAYGLHDRGMFVLVHGVLKKFPVEVL